MVKLRSNDAESDTVTIFVSGAVFVELNERAKAKGLSLVDYVSSLLQLAGSGDR